MVNGDDNDDDDHDHDDGGNSQRGGRTTSFDLSFFLAQHYIGNG